MNRRLKILMHWLGGRTNGVSALELASFMLGRTCTPKAKAVIEGTTVEDGFLAVKLKGLNNPLYFPAEFALVSLYHVIAEQYYKDWHNYETCGTPVFSSDTVVDCGAAEGLFSLVVSKRCRRVYAVEPLPRFVDSLNMTFKKAPNVEVVPCALSDEPGTGSIAGDGIDAAVTSGGAGGAGNVEISTVDALFLDKGITVDYIKADLEGYEMKMLKGAERTIRQCAPRIAITTYHVASHAKEIEAFLRSLVPSYRIRTKGIEERAGSPVMLHAVA